MKGKRRRADTLPKLKLHPLFWLVGVWFCLRGSLFLFLMSCLVALQHECAHAFAAARLGYKLNKIVLMPFGAVIDGDLRDISLQDEIIVAAYGPLCNVCTAAFFAALWWFFPDTYAFTDTACFASLSIAAVNLLPAYPLDGGRVFRLALALALAKTKPQASAERLAEGICRGLTLGITAALFALFVYGLGQGETHVSLAVFAVFLGCSAFGNRGQAAYARADFSVYDGFLRGLEIKRVALSEKCPVKDVFRHITRGAYLILEVFDVEGERLFELSQNEFSRLFLNAPHPYETLENIVKMDKKQRKKE